MSSGLRPRGLDLSDLICHLIDSIVDDEAFERLPELLAGYFPHAGGLGHHPSIELNANDCALERRTKVFDACKCCGGCNPASDACDERASQTERSGSADLHPDWQSGVDLFAAPLTRVLQGRRRLTARTPNLAQMVLDGQIDAVLVVDHDGVLQFANASARRIIETSTVLTLNQGRISSPDPLIVEALRKLIRSAGKGRGGYLSFPPGATEYRGSIERLPGADAALVCIRLRDERAWAAARAEQARVLHGLTAAEAQLAEALLLGLAAGEIAEQRNVSMATVRTQLRSLYAKTDVTGMAELKRVLDRI